jgi:hypothetical protein
VRKRHCAIDWHTLALIEHITEARARVSIFRFNAFLKVSPCRREILLGADSFEETAAGVGAFETESRKLLRNPRASFAASLSTIG